MKFFQFSNSSSTRWSGPNKYHLTLDPAHDTGLCGQYYAKTGREYRNGCTHKPLALHNLEGWSTTKGRATVYPESAKEWTCSRCLKKARNLGLDEFYIDTKAAADAKKAAWEKASDWKDTVQSQTNQLGNADWENSKVAFRAAHLLGMTLVEFYQRAADVAARKHNQ